jgi:hydrogenase expression/formation protein HypC
MCLAVPGKLVSRFGDDPLTAMGKVRFGGITKEICLTFVPEAKVGDYILVHVGMGIGIIDEEEANRVYDYLKQMDALEGIDEPQRDGLDELGMPRKDGPDGPGDSRKDASEETGDSP